MTIEKEILKVLKDYPNGIRLRYLASKLSMAVNKLIPILYKLEKENTIKCKTISDPANMEYYNLWILN